MQRAWRRWFLLPLTGYAESVVGFEWWVHSKASSRALGNRHGHQLHFDTEEGVLYGERELVHPAVSSVLYLTGASVAGPTLVLDQRHGGAPASRCHVCQPADATVLLFPGDRLHGVCPAAPTTPFAASRPQRNGRAPPLCSTKTLPRRLTLMIGFWTQDIASRLRRAPLSACGPMPRASRSCTWPTLLALDGRDDVSRGYARGVGECPPSQPTQHTIPEVSPAWEEVTDQITDVPGRSEHDGWVMRRAGSSDAPSRGTSLLRVPDERNNHFFVTAERIADEFAFDHLGEPSTSTGLCDDSC